MSPAHDRPEEETAADRPSRTQAALAWCAVILLAAFLVGGLALNGFSMQVLERTWSSVLERPSGPLKFRFILQPAMAALAALHDGIRDARLSRTPYLRSLFTEPHLRVERLREGLISTARVLLLGLAMDTIYQLIEFKTFYPGEAVVVALLLAFLPYLLLRGLFERVGIWRMRKRDLA